MFVKSHERMLPAAIEAQQKRIKDPARTKMVRSDSGGLVALMDGDDRRKEGTTQIARQISLENKIAKKNRAKEIKNEKAMSLREDQKMNSYLEKIHREHHSIEQWQNSHRKQQMLQNIKDSLAMRERIDREKAEHLLTKEANLNKL